MGNRNRNLPVCSPIQLRHRVPLVLQITLRDQSVDFIGYVILYIVYV
jgi:hypothetical protein